MTSQRYVHDVLAYNYRMTNIQVALLFPQLEHVYDLLERRRRVFAAYEGHFRNSGHSRIHLYPDRALWVVVIRVRGCDYRTFEQWMLSDRSVEVRPMFYPI